MRRGKKEATSYTDNEPQLLLKEKKRRLKRILAENKAKDSKNLSDSFADSFI